MRSALASGYCRQEQDGLLVGGRLDIGRVDAGISEHQAEAIRDDNSPWTDAQHSRQFLQDDLDKARILFAATREFAGALGRLHIWQAHQAAFGLGDDLLRHDQEIIVAQRQACPLGRNRDQHWQVGAARHRRDAVESGQRSGSCHGSI